MAKNSLKNMFSKMKFKITLISVVAIILVAAILRLYRIADYMTFLGDEGRDVLVAKGILEGHLTLLGPRSSAGDFFMGPVYYYMIAPFLWLWRLDPVGPAIMVALFGVATVFLIYWFGKQWFGRKAGFIAAAIYSINPLVLIYSRSSWNPNVVPFFALLSIYFIWKATITKKNSFYWYLFVGVLLGIGLQLHYVVLFLVLAIIVYVLVMIVWKKMPIITTSLIAYLGLFVGFIIGFAPFLAFEARHGFPNTRAIFALIFSDTVTKNPQQHVPYFSVVQEIFFRVFGRLLINYPSADTVNHFQSLTLFFWGGAVVILALAAILALWYHKNRTVVLLFSLWLFVGILSFGFYKKSIYDYYFVFLFPLPALLFGNLVTKIITYKKWYPLGVIAAVILVILVFVTNIAGWPFQKFPNRQKNQAELISRFIIQQADNKPYNFAFISTGNSDYEYRYYLEILGHPPVMIDNQVSDPQRKTVTDQLLIVCDPPGCKPLGNSLFDVAAFGRAEIVNSWDVSVVKVYKMKHYTGKD